jgi:hypothetical protein
VALHHAASKRFDFGAPSCCKKVTFNAYVALRLRDVLLKEPFHQIKLSPLDAPEIEASAAPRAKLAVRSAGGEYFAAFKATLLSIFHKYPILLIVSNSIILQNKCEV